MEVEGKEVGKGFVGGEEVVQMGEDSEPEREFIMVRTEDLTLDGEISAQLPDAGMVSPARDLFMDETLSNVAAVWGTSPMSPFRFMSPGRAAFLGTPTKDWSQLSPFNTLNFMLPSPARQIMQSPSERAPDLSPSKLISTINASDSKGLNMDWPSMSPLKFEVPPRTYKRRLQISDFVAASADASKGNARDPLSTLKKEVTPNRSALRDRENLSYPSWNQNKRLKFAGQGTPMGRGTAAKAYPQPLVPVSTENKERELKTPQPELDGPKRGCNCKKSECLKLYCDCFAAQGMCGKECKCVNCRNNEDNLDAIEAAVKQVLEKKPFAFAPKIQSREASTGLVDGSMVTIESHNRGCNCRKSGCQKKYCECFNAGVMCGLKCRCQGCQNCDDSHPNAAQGSRSKKLLDTSSVPREEEHIAMRSKLARKLDFENVQESPQKEPIDHKIDFNGVRRRMLYLR